MRIRYEPQPGHLLVVLEGDFDAAAARRGLGEVVAQCRKHQLAKVLIDGRAIESVISIADRHELASVLATAGASLRIAVVVSPENMFTKTFENTATNRGMSLRTTPSMDEAVAYLR
jgi:anti-anti-sigma regulatory factor